MGRQFRISNLLVSVAPPKPNDGAASAQRLCLITCNDGQHSLVCEPYSRSGAQMRGCLITCNDGQHSLVCEPYSRGASPYRWCTLTCLQSSEVCQPQSRRDERAAIDLRELAALKQDLKDALAEVEDYEQAVATREPQTVEDIESAEQELTQALQALKERKARLATK